MSDRPRYDWTLLRAGPLLLDGGGMFGLIPRTIWTRLVTPDEHNRVALAHNCVLLTGRPGTPAQGRTVLIETGTGNKLEPKMADIFGIRSWIGDALHAAGTSPESITDVVVSHLHFDHAGGLTRRCTEDESPEWTGPGASGPQTRVVRSFPNARVHVQRREWDDAINNRSVMTRTYYRDHLEPIADHLALCDAPRPFPVGLTPDRDQIPLAPVEHRAVEIIPGVRVFLVPGHTWGQQAVMFTDTDDRTIVFTPDVMPTRWHVGAAYSLAYDVEPYTSMISRRLLLADAAQRGWVLLLDHEPASPLCTVRHDKDWFALDPLPPDQHA